MKCIYPYLKSTTQLQIIELINEVIFKKHSNIIYDEVIKLIEKEDIQGIYSKFIYTFIRKFICYVKV